MKIKINNFLFVLIALAFAAGCDFNHPVSPASPDSPDSWFAPSGDAIMDSLLRVAAVAPQDTNLAQLYFYIGRVYFRGQTDFPNAKEFFLKGKALSEKLSWSKGFYQFAAYYADIIGREGFADSCIAIHQEALALAKKEKKELMIALSSANLGSHYEEKGWYETALEYHLEALSIVEKFGDNLKIAQLCDLIAIVYKHLSMYDECLKYYEKALDLTADMPNTSPRADIFTNYAIALIRKNDKKDFDKAEKCLLEAERINKLNHRTFDLSTVYGNMAIIAGKKYDDDKSEMYLRKVLEILQGANFVDHIATAYNSLAGIALRKGNFKQSEEYAVEALKIAIEYELLEIQKACYHHFADLEMARHEFHKRDLYSEKADSIDHLLVSEKTRLYAAEMQAKYETGKKELEIERQQLIIGRQNQQRAMLVVGIAVCALVLVLLWYMLRLRIRRNRTLADMNDTKNKFFSIISHDLKNPADAQLEAIQLLVNNARLWDADTLSNYYHELLKSAETEVELVHTLLNWARLQTGRITFTPETFNFVSRFRSDISLARTMCEKKGITLRVAIPDHAQITGDGNMLSTVVRNLLTNAVKFTAAGGTVSLTVEPASSGKHIVNVCDTGTGMTKEQISDLFRLDSTHSRKGTAGEQGTGLGLIVCKELLEKHGSELHVESEVGKGSRFWFELKGNY